MTKQTTKIAAAEAGLTWKPKRTIQEIIQNPTERGEWVESLFLARARELGLPVSKPWGDSDSFDFVVGRPGRFVSVQVKSTTCRSGGGYECCILGRQNEAYAPGSFDFLAAYVVLEDVWYIIPVAKVAGKQTICLFSKSKTAKYEKYREAWHLFREAVVVGEKAAREEPESAERSTELEAGETSLTPAPTSQPANFPTSALGRMEAAGNYFKRYLERGSAGQRKESDEV